MTCRPSRIGRVAALVALFLSLHLPAPVLAQGFSIPEMGTRKNAMGAVIGRPDDPSAVYHNPAGLADQEGTRVFLSAGTVFLSTSVRLKPWDKSSQFITDPVGPDGYYPAASPSTYAVIPMVVLSSNLWSDRLVGALSVYVPNAAGAMFDREGVTRYHMIESYIVSGFATVSAAYKAFSWLSVGAGVSATYVRFHMDKMLFPVVGGQDMSMLLKGDTEVVLDGEDVVPVFNMGALIRPIPSLSIGLAMISGYDLTLEGDLEVRTSPDSPLFKGLVLTGTQSTTVKAPWLLFFGANWDVTPWLEVGAELRWYTTSIVDQQVTRIQGIPLLEELVTPKNWNDYYQVSGGINFHPPGPVKAEVMLGVHYESSCTPDNTIAVEQPAFSHYGIHMGVRYPINETFRVAFAYWHYEYLRRVVSDSITEPPTNFDGSAMSDALTLVFEARVAGGLGL